METKILSANDPQAIQLAQHLLHKQELVAFPTDTVYGVGASLKSAQSIEKLFQVKGRDSTKAIPVLLGEFSQISQVALKLSSMAEQFAGRFWPGPLTLVVARRLDLPENLSPIPTIGIRMPDHPVALNLLTLIGPLAVTSANLSGAANATTARQVYDQLGGRIALILDGGRTPGEMPSTVVDCTGETPKILREGPISLSMLLAVLPSS
jgi:L-threonylcarbamoyladenylate synthase